MSELITGGFNLMIMGMGTVFVFLAILVVGTTFMSQIIMRLPNPHEMDNSHSAARRSGSQDDLAEIAAVAAAVKSVHR